MDKIISVKVVPGAKVEQIQESIDTSIKVWVKGQPKEGEANKALLKLLAKYYNIPVASLKIIMGTKSRNKLIKIHYKEG